MFDKLFESVKGDLKDQYVYAVWGNCKELKLRQSDLDSIPRHGPADEAIDVLVKEPHIAEQLDAYDADDIRKELKEYGAWDDEELQDDEQNRKRLLWVLIGNLQEEQVRKGDEGSEDEPEESEEG